MTAQIVVFPYVLAFAFLAFLPGWRSLLVCSIAALLLCVWALNDVLHADGFGAVFAFIAIAIASLGFFAGFLARGIILVGSSFGWRAARPVLVLPLVFVGVFGSAYAWMVLERQVSEARLAPPSLACAERLHPATLGEVRLALPLAPVISVGQGWEYAPTYQFRINQHAREFCDEAMSSPPSLTKLNLDLSWYGNRGVAAKNYAFCARPRPFAWWTAACERDAKVLADYPEEMTVYVLGSYNASRMHAISAESPVQFRAEMAGLPQKALGGGYSQYVGTRYSYFTRPDPAGYVARCYQSSSVADGNDLYCSTGYAFSAGLGLIYDFRSNERQFAQQSARIDQMARTIFQSLSEP